MGTSSDRPLGKGGAWTSYKTGTSNFVRHGGSRRADTVLARYVAAMGGAAAAAATAAAAGMGRIQGVADFGVGLATEGLPATLERLGLGHLVGADRYEVLDGLLATLGGDGATVEDVAILSALCEAFEELYPEDAETFEQLEEIRLDVGGLVEFIERFVARWVYDRMLPTLAEKLATIDDPTLIRQRDAELRERLLLLVQLELEDRDALAIGWRQEEGEEILTRLVGEIYQDMEDLDA